MQNDFDREVFGRFVVQGQNVQLKYEIGYELLKVIVSMPAAEEYDRDEKLLSSLVRADTKKKSIVRKEHDELLTTTVEKEKLSLHPDICDVHKMQLASITNLNNAWLCLRPTHSQEKEEE